VTTGRRVKPEGFGRPFVLMLCLAPRVVVESARDGGRREPTGLAVMKHGMKY